MCDTRCRCLCLWITDGVQDLQRFGQAISHSDVTAHDSCTTGDDNAKQRTGDLSSVGSPSVIRHPFRRDIGDAIAAAPERRRLQSRRYKECRICEGTSNRPITSQRQTRSPPRHLRHEVRCVWQDDLDLIDDFWASLFRTETPVKAPSHRVCTGCRTCGASCLETVPMKEHDMACQDVH